MLKIFFEKMLQKNLTFSNGKKNRYRNGKCEIFMLELYF